MKYAACGPYVKPLPTVNSAIPRKNSHGLPVSTSGKRNHTVIRKMIHPAM